MRLSIYKENGWIEGGTKLVRILIYSTVLPFFNDAMRFIPALVLLAVSAIQPSALALAGVAPLTKRHYSPELKASLAQIDERWKGIEKIITGIPKERAKVQDFRVRTNTRWRHGRFL